jgi:hypothetical protein
MSSISGVGRSHHGHYPKIAKSLSTDPVSTSLTPSAPSGSVTGSIPALGTAAPLPKLPGGVLKQIEQAVTSALQASKPTDDPHQVIRDAIANVLKQNKSAASNQDDSSTPDTSDADGTHRTLDQTLQAYGISPKQFSAQLSAALHAANPNSTASNISSFPPGLVLDTTA